MRQNDRAAAFSGQEAAADRPNEQIEAQAQALLQELSLDEKLKMMDGDTPLWPAYLEMMAGAHSEDQNALTARFRVSKEA